MSIDSDPRARGNKLALADAPDRNMHSFGSPKSLTFDEVEAAAWSLACELFNAGIRRDDVILVQLPNITEHVITKLALELLGASVKSVAMNENSEYLGTIAKTHPVTAYISTTDYHGESFTCSHQAAFPDGTLILAFGETEPESAQLIGETIADIEALDACQQYVRKERVNSTNAIDLAAFPIDLALHKIAKEGP